MHATDAFSSTRWCPPWCVTAHDPARGEDDWVHVSEPLMLTDGVTARLCMSVDPATGEEDGPYVLVGEEQLTPAQAERLGIELSALAALASRPPAPGAAS
jgi:hypothetical protein